MTLSIRPAAPDDFARVAELMTLADPEPTSADDLRDEAARQVPGKVLRRLVALLPDGGIVGQGWTIHYPSQSAGLFHGGVGVAPAHRGKGVGARLYEEILAFAAARGATVLATEIPERHAEGLAFAQRRGFEVHRQAIGATLDLATFDEDRFAGLRERVEASGIRLFSLADEGIREETLRKLYRINRVAVVDDPAAIEPTFPTFEVWRRLLPDAPGFQPEGQFLAADGNEWVGLSAIDVDADSQSASTLITGVAPGHRGRGIALALKLLAIRHAQARGATHIVTETDARNQAMMTINRKLGFQPLPGYFGLQRRVEGTAQQAG